MGQSIGLHVDAAYKEESGNPKLIDHELRRRTWYSMFVLDRLLALQLGRPTAIHETDFAVMLPSRDEIPDIDINSEPELSQMDLRADRNKESARIPDESIMRTFPEREPSMIDYFLCVIQFSHILGQVLRELYHPTQVESPPEEMLLSASAIDKSLSAWRNSLPYHLRYDLGHTFEKSRMFKRQVRLSTQSFYVIIRTKFGQRNMLAVKAHQLRALIHRPFLCLRWLQRDSSPLAEMHRDDIGRAERICVFEAQQTARLLHNIEDERSLIHDFPWWQMVSCLICASSILLIADSFLQDEDNSAELQHQDFRKDAENCLKVFEALSVNTEAARRARAVLARVTERQRTGGKGFFPHPSSLAKSCDRF